MPDFIKASSDLLELISEVDCSVSPDFQPTIEWKLKRLSYSSPAEMVAEAVVKEDRPDNRSQVIDSTLNGIDILRKTNDRPRGFNDKALEKARELSKMMSNGVDRIEVLSDDSLVELTLNMIDNVTTILKPGREIFGAIEGHLETLNSHDGFKFVIYEPVLLRRIRCELLNKNDLHLKKRVYELYEHSVLVTGLLATNIRGEVQSAKIDNIHDRDRKQMLKDASYVTGIYDIGGDIDPVEYVRSLRE